MERIELLKTFIREDPSDHFSVYALALEYIKINRLEDAKDLLEKLLAQNPDYLAAYYQLGKLLETQKNIPGALAVLEQGMKIAQKQKDRKTFNELQSARDLLDD